METTDTESNELDYSSGSRFSDHAMDLSGKEPQSDSDTDSRVTAWTKRQGLHHSAREQNYINMKTDSESIDQWNNFGKEELDHSYSSSRNGRIQNKHERWEKKNMSDKLKEKTEKNKRLEGLLNMVNKQLSEKEEENCRLNGQLKKVNIQLKDKEEENCSLEGQLKKVNKQMKEKEKENSSLEEQLKKVNIQLKEKEEENCSLEGQLKKVNKQMKEKEEENSSLEGQLKNVNIQLKEKEEENCSLEGQLKKVNQQMKDKEDENSSLEEQLKKVNIQLKEKEEENCSLEGQLKKVNKQMKEKEEENSSLEEQLKKANIQFKEKEEENSSLEEQLKKANIQLKEKEEKNSSLEGQLTEKEEEMRRLLLEANHKHLKLQKKINSLIWLIFMVILVSLRIGLHFTFQEHEVNYPELRLMLVGKTGAGKSASANTIMGEKAFRVEASPESVTKNCEVMNKVLEGKNITIIDTPGVMDTWLISEQKAHHAHDCIFNFSPKPHVLLLVIRLGRFTAEENNAVKWIQENFGEEALNFTMILFTGGDLLEGKPVEKFISNSYDLQNLVDTCKGRYHVFNNYDQSNRTQVKELLEKINVMLHLHMGYFYTQERSQYKRESNLT